MTVFITPTTHIFSWGCVGYIFIFPDLQKQCCSGVHIKRVCLPPFRVVIAPMQHTIFYRDVIEGVGDTMFAAVGVFFVDQIQVRILFQRHTYRHHVSQGFIQDFPLRGGERDRGQG